MILTEADLRDRLRRPVAGAVVAVPPGVRLTPAAADFVAQWKLELTQEPADMTRQTPATPTPPQGGGQATQPAAPARPDWDADASFPVDRDATPLCTQCGCAVTAKPAWLTQLNHNHYVAKTHPRIVLRGQLDTLGAQLLAAAAEALAAGQQEAGANLATLAAYCRELLSAEYNERPAGELVMAGWDDERIHRATHDPVTEVGVPHMTLTERSAPLQHHVNLARARSREVEVTAAGVFPSPHHPYGASVCQGLNRLSSACYLVQLLLARGGVT
ncbi:hypothetical protein [Xylanimonas ulmi]|uniref:Ethanolamine utilization cobalamin adenosyltransferase n=1 Tax=Xylanimonas ulmi TaxID=228973 RepID=A0A4Q7M121_9MICO|nr:hypothetical protein [Xylanibacterium ulmi]RZS60058.1 ethanolamine utilization cobalamin adenosyltransferase [Xylanibacterium ulmi]